jgi:hypothetical protein
MLTSFLEQLYDPMGMLQSTAYLSSRLDSKCDNGVREEEEDLNLLRLHSTKDAFSQSLIDIGLVVMEVKI